VLLAAGVVSGERRGARTVGAAALAVPLVAGIVWVAPPFLLRRHPAPVWDALAWVTEHYDRARTVAVIDPSIRVHAAYVLERASFPRVDAKPTTVYGASFRRDGQVLVVAETPIPGFPVILERRWDSARLRRLTRDRYTTCLVMATPDPDQPVFSPDWRAEKGQWRLAGTGRVHVSATAHPVVLRLCAGNDPLPMSQAGVPDLTLREHECVERALTPGPVGDLLVTAPSMVRASMPPGEIVPLGAGDASLGRLARAYMLPVVAHAPGRTGAFWQTDVLVANPHAHPLAITMSFLPSTRENRAARRATRVLGPHEVLELNDVLSIPQLDALGDVGAMLLGGGDTGAACAGSACGFLAFLHTFNARAEADARGAGEWLPGLPPEAGLRPGGRAVFENLTLPKGAHLSFGLASWTDTALRVRGTLLGAAGSASPSRTFGLPAFGHLHVPLDLKLRDSRIAVELMDPPPQAIVFTYLSVVNGSTDRATYVLPSIRGGSGAATGGEPALPVEYGAR